MDGTNKIWLAIALMVLTLSPLSADGFYWQRPSGDSRVPSDDSENLDCDDDVKKPTSIAERPVVWAKSRAICPDDEEFVCGDDSVTYQNECFLRQAIFETKQHIRLHHKGRCMGARTVVKCPKRCSDRVTLHICDRDGTRHFNICMFKMHRCGRPQQEVYHPNNKRCSA